MNLWIGPGRGDILNRHLHDKTIIKIRPHKHYPDEKFAILFNVPYSERTVQYELHLSHGDIWRLWRLAQGNKP